MQKWLGRPWSLPPRAREDAKLTSRQLCRHWLRGRAGRQQRGSATRTRRPRAPAPVGRSLPRASCPRRGLEPAPGGPSAGQRVGDPAGVGPSPEPSGPPIPAPATRSQLARGVPGTPGMGRGRLPVAALGAEGRRDPPGVAEGRPAWRHNFLRPEAGSAGVALPRPAGGPHAREPPAAGRRGGDRGRRGLRR